MAMGEMAAGVTVPFEFLLCGFTEPRTKRNIMTKIQALGGRANNASTYDVKCTHVISYKPIRTENYICGVASGKWILKPEFITDSFAKGKWQAESTYEWSEGDVSENVVPGLLTAPRRWREKIAASGHRAFHDWKVLLHKNTYAIWIRVLEAGGGQCVPVTFPIKEPARLVSSVTHVIVDKCHEKDVQCLKERGKPCLPLKFIVEHLFQENPNWTQFHESSALMTPPEAIRQKNIVVPTVRAKEDHDTFQNRRQTNPSGRESDTPVSMVSPAEEGTSSDPGNSVKRKLDLDSLHISKKRKTPNDATTSKAPNIRRSQRLQSNTKDKTRSRETLPSSKLNLGKDEVSGGSIADHSPKSLPRKTDVNLKGETQLHVACIKNNITKVRELLNKPDIDVNARDNAEWTPLHEACNHGHTACVKELLKFAPGKRKFTSTESRSMEPLNLLAAPSKCGTTPLHDAVFNNHIEVVKLLIEAGGSNLLTVRNKKGFTPVDMALTEVMKEVILGQRSEVSRLSAVDEENENNSGTEGRSVEPLNLLAAPSDYRTTPLHNVVFTSQIEVVKLLVEAGGIIIPTAKNKTGCTPVNVAEIEEEGILGQRSEVSRLPAFDEENENNSGTESRSMQTVDCMQAAPSDYGTTPLHDAVTNNHIEVVKPLVEAGGISDSCIMSKASGKYKCTQCSYSSKRRHDVKRHFSRKHGKGQIHGRESSPERTTPNHTAVQSIITPGARFMKNLLQCRKRGVIRRIVSSDGDSSESVSAICSRPSHSSTSIDKPKTEKTRIDFNPNGDSKKKKIVHFNMNSNMSSESVGFVNSKRANNALTGVNNKNKQKPNTEQEVESYVKDAKKCNGSLADSSLNEQMPEGGSLLTCENNAGCTPVNVDEREEEGILGQRSEVNRLPAYDEKNENKGSLLTCENNAGFTPVNVSEREEEGILGQRSEVNKLPAIDKENENRGSLLTCENNAGCTPVNVDEREEEGILGQRSEVNRLPAYDKKNENRGSLLTCENNAGCTPVNVAEREEEGILGQRSEVNRLPAIDKENENRSAMARLPSEKDDASVTPVSFRMDDLLLRAAKSVPMDKIFDLGTALEIDHPQIERYNLQNNNGSCKYEGTLKMLHDWNIKDNNIRDLLAALERAEMNKISKRLKLKFNL